MDELLALLGRLYSIGVSGMGEDGDLQPHELLGETLLLNAKGQVGLGFPPEDYLGYSLCSTDTEMNSDTGFLKGDTDTYTTGVTAIYLCQRMNMHLFELIQ